MLEAGQCFAVEVRCARQIRNSQRYDLEFLNTQRAHARSPFCFNHWKQEMLRELLYLTFDRHSDQSVQSLAKPVPRETDLRHPVLDGEDRESEGL